jgi:predicted SAM-dependent methyltransferase
MKLDIGCGVQKKPGFIGLDKIGSPDILCDFLKEKLPFDDNSVEEIFCADVIEHLTYQEMVILMNEIYRICIPKAKVIIHTVHGIKGWTNHPPHIRPIFNNQFNYFHTTESETIKSMREADGIKSIFNKVNISIENGNLYFQLEVIK